MTLSFITTRKTKRKKIANFTIGGKNFPPASFQLTSFTKLAKVIKSNSYTSIGRNIRQQAERTWIGENYLINLTGNPELVPVIW